jgi:hypothetical protein
MAFFIQFLLTPAVLSCARGSTLFNGGQKTLKPSCFGSGCEVQMGLTSAYDKIANAGNIVVQMTPIIAPACMICLHDPKALTQAV